MARYPAKGGREREERRRQFRQTAEGPGRCRRSMAKSRRVSGVGLRCDASGRRKRAATDKTLAAGKRARGRSSAGDGGPRSADAGTARGGAVAGVDPPLVMAALGRAAGEGQRRAKMRGRGGAVAAAQLELAERRGKERVSGEAIRPV